MSSPSSQSTPAGPSDKSSINWRSVITALGGSVAVVGAAYTIYKLMSPSRSAPLPSVPDMTKEKKSKHDKKTTQTSGQSTTQSTTATPSTTPSTPSTTTAAPVVSATEANLTTPTTAENKQSVVVETESEGVASPPTTQQKKKKKSTSSSSSSSSSTSSAVKQISPEEVMKIQQQFSEAFEEAGLVGHISQRVEQQCRITVNKMVDVPAKFPNICRALGAQFLLTLHHIAVSNSVTEEDFDRLFSPEAKDMPNAWSLLDAPTDNKDETRLFDVLRLQVATNLHDTTKMIPVFDRMAVIHFDDMTEQELILLFTTAPLLGRWKLTRQLGDRLKKARKSNLSEFRGGHMDYMQIYELAREEVPNESKYNSEFFEWKQYRITQQRIRLKSVKGKAEVEQKLREEFADDQDPKQLTWKHVPLSSSSILMRCGALVQLMSCSNVDVTLVGPATDKTILCKGLFDMADNSDEYKRDGVTPHKYVRQTEKYNLSRVSAEKDLEGKNGHIDMEQLSEAEKGKEQYWKGTYVMNHFLKYKEEEEIDEVKTDPVLTVTFDLEMALLPAQ